MGRRDTAAATLEDDLAGCFRLYNDYDASFVMFLKLAVPPSGRTWNGTERYWVIDMAYLDEVRKLLKRFGYDVEDGITGNSAGSGGQQLTENIRMNYLGNVRSRSGGLPTAMGMDEVGNWIYVFPEKVLRDWFGERANPAAATTFYEALGVNPSATAAEIKSAYRQGVREWHPDVNAAPEAADAFRALTAAYDTLSDGVKRAAYDFGLVVAATESNEKEIVFVTPDRWRCGYLTVTGIWVLGKLNISGIIRWQDIENNNRRLESRWTGGHVEYEWVQY